MKFAKKNRAYNEEELAERETEESLNREEIERFSHRFNIRYRN